MSVIRVNIDQENNKIVIFHNGKGIPVVKHTEVIHFTYFHPILP